MPTHGHGLAAASGSALAYVLANRPNSFAASILQNLLMRCAEKLRQGSLLRRFLVHYATQIILSGLVLSEYGLVCAAYTKFRDFINARLRSHVTIRFGHALVDLVVEYLAENELKDSHFLSLSEARPTKRLQDNGDTGALQDPNTTWADMPSEDPKLHEGPKDSSVYWPDEDEERRRLTYVMDNGSHDFTFQGYRMRLHAENKRRKDRHGELYYTGLNITISPLKQFLDHVTKVYAEYGEGMTEIFRPEKVPVESYTNDLTRYLRWDAGVLRQRRKLAAVTLDTHVKEPLVREIQDFLEPRTERFYAENAIPYRRGYLLYGPPGTGKSTFAAAVAGQYGLSIFTISLSHADMTDENLETLFDRLPKRCIVLVEDIDSAGIKRGDMRAKRDRIEKTKASVRARKPSVCATSKDSAQDNASESDDSDVDLPKRQPNGQILTLSGVLNVFDGVRAAEGRILIVTSNKPDRLDKALFRSGRIDRKILFGYVSREVARKLFERMFIRRSVEQLLAGDNLNPIDRIAGMAVAFAEQIPEHSITPAQIQSHLLGYRRDPAAAMAATSAYVAGIMADNRRGTDVAEFETDFRKTREAVRGDREGTPDSSAASNPGSDVGEACKLPSTTTEDISPASWSSEEVERVEESREGIERGMLGCADESRQHSTR
ncbi:hypothetical protein LTR53_000363 [Teratosphaeriaceae sp. CCFEE 6253]|nr:hypothetical protein LTR53_000363 [Teratosphaeriaceae sp. CCFEE 6253]